MKLSLCIATYNEEKNIHYALDSTYSWVDEVIIVDGGSTDKTVEIAKSYSKKVKVYITNNPPMFHINKQKAIEKAKGKWILQLDADESVTKELRKEILSIVNNNSNEVAFWVPRKNLFLDRFLTKGGVYPDYTIRLYKNGTVRFPCKDVHENVELINKKDKVGYLKKPLLHYADPDFSRYIMRWNRYTTLEAKKLPKRLKKRNKTLLFIDFFIWRPIKTFCSMYIRHRGFQDGLPGFIFALFSSIRFWAIYIKFLFSDNTQQ